MQVIQDQTISLKRESGNGRAEIMIGARPTGQTIEAVVLEAALTCYDNYLLFATTDTPFEETLSIYLIRRDGSILDSLWIGAPYATGSFSGLRVVGTDSVNFRFLGDTDWTLRVLPSSKLSLPFIRDVPGVRRPFGFRRRLIVHGSPKRENQ